MIYGYIRTSTAHQNPERQKENILKACNDPSIKLEIEVYTGKTQDRPKWKRLYRQLQPGDTVYFDEVSRMSRNAEEGFKEWQELYTRGVDLIFLKEPYCSTTDFREQQERTKSQIKTEKTGDALTDELFNGLSEILNKYTLGLAKRHIEQAFEHGEKELELLSARTKEGIRTAQAKRLAEIEKNGYSTRNPPGRKPGSFYITKKQLKTQDAIERHSIDFGGTLTDREIMNMCGVSRGSYYKYKNELKKDRIMIDRLKKENTTG